MSTEELQRRLDTALKLHQPGTEYDGSHGGMGYTAHGYGTVDPACATCGTFDEYAVPWPCPTAIALGVDPKAAA